jgi:glycosyltransferase involved in cell wall biosynthesis
MKPLISILIPAFNAQDWIAQTLQSAITQTWERKEIIVVDDGSTDQTLAVARTFASKGVIVVSMDHQGAAAARNKALSLSHGDYIQWLDADDLLAPDKIAKQLEKSDLAGNKWTLLSSAWGSFMYRPDKADFTQTSLWCNLSPLEWLIRKMEQNFHMQTSTWLVTRALTEAAGPWDTRLSTDDDGEYFCRVLLKSEGVRFVPEAKVYYRMSGTNSLSYIGRSDKKMDSQFLSMQMHIGYLRSMEDTKRVRVACVKYLQNWMIHFYPERPDIVNRAEQMATKLDGRLMAPQLSWKYSWIRSLFGWGMAKRAQIVFPEIKWLVARNWDRILFHLAR